MVNERSGQDGARPGEPDPVGPTEPVRAVREALATRRHAEMLFDQVADLLGEEAWVETWNNRTRRFLFRREAAGADTFAPWPVLALDTAGRIAQVSPAVSISGEPAPEVPPRPGRPPRLRGLGPGEVVIHDGPTSVTVTYGEDGRWMETSRKGGTETLAAILPALARRSAQPVELLAEFVAGLDPRRVGPGLAYLPVPLPAGVGGAFGTGVPAIREALFSERIPWSARWVVADGYQGSAVASGGSREDAVAAWRAEVDRVRPCPPRPAPPPELPPESVAEPLVGSGGFAFQLTTRGPTSDVARPEPSPENTPAALVPLADAPPEPPPVGRWVRLIGGFGRTVHAVLRPEPEGFTLIGRRVLGLLDLDRLDERLDAADRSQDERTRQFLSARPADRPPPGCSIRTYRVIDGETGLPTAPKIVSDRRSPEFRPGSLDGDLVEWSVLRRRRLRG